MKKFKKTLTTQQIESIFRGLRITFAIVISLVIAFLLISSVSENTIKDFSTLLFAPLRSTHRMITVVKKMIPLVFTGLAISLVNTAGQINISAEGAFFAGAVASTAVAVIEGIPAPLHIILVILAGAITGAVIMGIPGILHVKYNVVTIVAALMINYVALHLGLYIILNPLRDPGAGFEASYKFAESALLPKIFGNSGLSIGLIIAIVAIVFTVLLLFNRPLGQAIRTVGKNQHFAKYSGIPVNKTIISTSLIAGALAGIGGTVETLGNYERFMYTGFTNHGWDGIMISVLVGNNPKFVPLGAFFLAYLKTSGDALNLTSNVPTEIIDIIQAVIIIFVASERLLANWEHRKIVKNSQKQMVLKEAN